MDYKDNLGIDLHIHSTASDGTLTPSQIITMAQETGLGAIAITDHDTLAGSREALQLTLPATIEFISGVEISATPIPPYDHVSSYHILGYYVQIDHLRLNKTLDELQNVRRSRNHKIIDRLNQIGISITMDDLVADLTTGELGRPHIAAALVKKNIVGDIDEAFDTYLGKGKPAYVDKKRLSCEEAIGLILAAGGVPVLAHPGLLNIEHQHDMESLIISLKKMGLKGLEVHYPEHSSQTVNQLLGIAASHDLLVTGGTDFHGDIKPDIYMGSGYGEQHVPYALFEALRLSVNKPDNLEILQTTLDYTFNDLDILAESVRHSSFVNEQGISGMRDNERFEFLGDAVLNLAVGHILMQRYPELKEGDLTRIRAHMVNETQLASIARQLNLGDHILFGKGEFLTGGHRKASILADAMEAIIAAIYLDGGYQTASAMIERYFVTLFDAVVVGAPSLDYKSELQEIVQFQHQIAPEYRITAEIGPDHDKTFHVQVTAGDIQCVGTGKSKKAAEQDAARQALAALRR